MLPGLLTRTVGAPLCDAAIRAVQVLANKDLVGTVGAPLRDAPLVESIRGIEALLHGGRSFGDAATRGIESENRHAQPGPSGLWD